MYWKNFCEDSFLLRNPCPAFESSSLGCGPVLIFAIAKKEIELSG